MIDIDRMLLFLVAALVIAVTPGPGIFYVAARTLQGGRSEGLASGLGTGVGGLVHIAAGAVGVSAIVMAIPEAFTLIKVAGAFYLLWLGVRTWRDAGNLVVSDVSGTGTRQAFCEGIVVEGLNPKTAAFFLAFVPQFVDPTRNIAAQFVVFGSISVLLNTGVDVVVAYWVAKAHASLGKRPSVIIKMRQVSGAVMCLLGATLLFARRSA